MKLEGIGVDLVDLGRIHKFLKQHSRRRVFRLLSKAEQIRFGKRKISARYFSKIFTAKEAYFKTLKESWMGLEGFASIETEFLPGGQFKIKCVPGALARKGPRPARGCFFSVGKLFGAQVMRWVD